MYLKLSTIKQMNRHFLLSKIVTLYQCYLCKHFQSVVWQNMKIRLVMVDVFVVLLNNIFTENVNFVTKYVN